MRGFPVGRRMETTTDRQADQATYSRCEQGIDYVLDRVMTLLVTDLINRVIVENQYGWGKAIDLGLRINVKYRKPTYYTATNQPGDIDELPSRRHTRPCNSLL